MTRIWAFMRMVNLKLIQYMYLTIKRSENMAALKYAKKLDQQNSFFVQFFVKFDTTLQTTKCHRMI